MVPAAAVADDSYSYSCPFLTKRLAWTAPEIYQFLVDKLLIFLVKLYFLLTHIAEDEKGPNLHVAH